MTATPDSLRVYLGTGGIGPGKGIWLSTLDLQAGTLGAPALVAEVDRPGFLALHPNGRWLYSVGQREQGDQSKLGVVYALAVDHASGKLSLLNEQPSGGDGPCHLVVDRDGESVLVANYGSGSVAALPIGPDGRLTEATSVIEHTGSGSHPKRQQGPHAHAIQVHPCGYFAFAADLGADRVFVYRYDSQAGLLKPLPDAALATEPGAGPRHMAFHPTLEVIYVINELDSTVLALRFDTDSERFELLQTITTLPENFAGDNYPSEVAVHPSGRFLYGANRGHDSLAVFAIDGSTGLLEPLGQTDIEGEFPRHFAIDPTGQYLIAAHQNTNNLAVFQIDAATGQPQFTGQHVELEAPMCVLYMPGS